MTKKLQSYFWLAVFVHLLLFLSFSLSLSRKTEQVFEKKSDKYLPAYFYQEPSQLSNNTQQSPQHRDAGNTPSKNASQAIALKKQQVQQNKMQRVSSQSSKHSSTKKLGSAAFIRAESPITGKPKDEPLLKELSRATAEKLFYPPEAAAFKLKGTAVIRFLLHPDGSVTEVKLAQTSGFPLLDNAALTAIQAISPVRDVNLYLTKPKVIVASIIFG